MVIIIIVPTIMTILYEIISIFFEFLSSCLLIMYTHIIIPVVALFTKCRRSEGVSVTRNGSVTRSYWMSTGLLPQFMKIAFCDTWIVRRVGRPCMSDASDSFALLLLCVLACVYNTCRWRFIAMASRLCMSTCCRRPASLLSGAGRPGR